MKEGSMNRFIVGLVTMCLAAWGLVIWWPTFGTVMRGLVPFCLLVFSLVNITSGLRQLRTKEE